MWQFRGSNSRPSDQSSLNQKFTLYSVCNCTNTYITHSATEEVALVGEIIVTNKNLFSRVQSQPVPWFPIYLVCVLLCNKLFDD